MASEEPGVRATPGPPPRRTTRRRPPAPLTPSGPFPIPTIEGLTAAPKERYPVDLAAEVGRQLAGTRAPSQAVLTALFEALYFASLRTEEARPVTCTVVWLAPDAAPPDPPAPTPAHRVRLAACDRGAVVRLSQPQPLTVATLIKLSAAADPAATALAVACDGGERLGVWGLVDQVRPDDADAPRLGLFQATIAAPAHIVVTSGGRAVASLIHGRLTRRFHDVFRRGPIHRALDPFVARYVRRVRDAIGAEGFGAEGAAWERALRHLWLATLGRLLLGVQAYRHGGALLLAPRFDEGDLRVVHGLRYRRLDDALVRLGATRVASAAARDRLWRGYLLDGGDHDLPADLHLEEGRSTTAEARGQDEVTGCVRFVASLTRVDGCVALDGDLGVHGFGVEITAGEDPPAVLRALDAEGTHTDPVDPVHHGTRHRSMMRYCSNHPGAVGLVVSQDGAVRAMIRVGEAVVLWETIELVESAASTDGEAD